MMHTSGDKTLCPRCGNTFYNSEMREREGMSPDRSCLPRHENPGKKPALSSIGRPPLLYYSTRSPPCVPPFWSFLVFFFNMIAIFTRDIFLSISPRKIVKPNVVGATTLRDDQTWRITQGPRCILPHHVRAVEDDSRSTDSSIEL